MIRNNADIKVKELSCLYLSTCLQRQNDDLNRDLLTSWLILIWSIHSTELSEMHLLTENIWLNENIQINGIECSMKIGKEKASVMWMTYWATKACFSLNLLLRNLITKLFLTYTCTCVLLGVRNQYWRKKTSTGLIRYPDTPIKSSLIAPTDIWRRYSISFQILSNETL